LQARPAGQSDELRQPHAPPTQAWPFVLLVQSAQVLPHAFAATGSTHAPEMQQAPEHGCDTEQATTHTWVDGLHDRPLGQSLDDEQPHAPPPGTAVQCCAPQSAHSPPAPQLASAIPPTQLPAALQQPPLHGWAALHEGVHR
jgi:hypothetical protein